MRFFSKSPQYRIGSTDRMENFSDALLAIIMTFLVLELHVPMLQDHTWQTFAAAIQEILPHVLTFAFSFLGLSVFWVNHHHFFHELDHADWRLLWYNNILLFWLSLIPFSTAFLGQNPMNSWALLLYSLIFFLGALTFMFMSRHALYVSDLTDKHITKEQKDAHYRRGWVGVYCYGAGAVLAPVFPWTTVILIVFVPLFYVTPRLMHDHEAML